MLGMIYKLRNKMTYQVFDLRYDIEVKRTGLRFFVEI